MPSPNRAIMLLVFMAVPLIEIALLIKIGQVIGFWATIGLVVATAALGTWLLHRQGMDALRRIMDATESGRPPIEPVLDGFVLIIAGLMLLTPGIITDAIGLILLIPPVRLVLVRKALSRLFIVTVGGRPWTGGQRPETTEPRPSGQAGHRPGRADAEDAVIIEGEYRRIDETTADPSRRKR